MADIESGSDEPGSDELGSDEPASVDARLAAIARHALHDEELVAAFAAGDVEDPTDEARAKTFIERCATCRDLHRDLIGIRAAIRASGTAEQRAATVTAPRDFRLSIDDATRLRPETPIARLATKLGFRAWLAAGIAAFGRPVGAAMATFGVVGLLVGSVTLNGGFLSAAGSAAAPSTAPGMEQTGPAPEATEDLGVFGPLATGGDSKGGGETNRDLFEGPSTAVVLLGGSGALLVVGIALVLAARRSSSPVQER